MPINQIEYHDIAKIQINTAIRLYNEENYICANILAKAAEEFLGKHLGDDAAHKILQQRIREMDPTGVLEKHLNRISSFLRHGSDLELCEQDLPIRADAIQNICRAISNYISFTASMTSLMNDFAKDHAAEQVDKIIESH